MREREILQQAMQHFNKVTGAVLQELPGRKLTNNADAVVELRFDKQRTQFLVEIKNEIRQINLPRILDQIGRKREVWLLVCQYIPKPLKENLKDQAINYLEAAGNCYINKNGFFFYINDQLITPHRKPKEGKLWKQAGLKFLFVILQKPELLNEPYRNMASTAKIALGNIGTFIQELKEEGFLKEGKNKKWFLENKEQLQKRWIELFNSILRPKLRQGRFRFLDRTAINNWEKIPTDKIYWGGEPAGAILTNYLQPEIFTIYTQQPKTEIMKQLKLVPDKEGNVELMDMFWQPEINGVNFKTVPPLLAYAELMNSLDSRNRETAERIKQKYLG
jgi:hypothetical protein